MRDTQIEVIASAAAIIRRRAADPYIMRAVADIEDALAPDLDRIDQEHRREQMATLTQGPRAFAPEVV